MQRTAARSTSVSSESVKPTTVTPASARPGPVQAVDLPAPPTPPGYPLSIDQIMWMVDRRLAWYRMNNMVIRSGRVVTDDLARVEIVDRTGASGSLNVEVNRYTSKVRFRA